MQQFSSPAMLLGLLFFLIPAAVFAATVGALRLGHRIAARRAARDESSPLEGVRTIEAALFALFGLLIAFSFSGAQSRLDRRRAMIVEEANAIGAAYLRMDLLLEPDRAPLKDRFRSYLDARIGYYRNLIDADAARPLHQRARELQQEIWDRAIPAAARAVGTPATQMVVPALNEMIDVSNARDAALRTHVPIVVFVLLGLMSLACGVLAGMGMAKAREPSRFHVFMFAGTMALTAYVILNLEFPRHGFVRFGLDAMLVQVRAEMR
jgi:hypothetical protein